MTSAVAPRKLGATSSALQPKNPQRVVVVKLTHAIFRGASASLDDAAHASLCGCVEEVPITFS